MNRFQGHRAESCANCKFGERSGDFGSLCHKKAPGVEETTEYRPGVDNPAWPNTKTNGWCGDWELDACESRVTVKGVLAGWIFELQCFGQLGHSGTHAATYREWDGDPVAVAWGDDCASDGAGAPTELVFPPKGEG